MNDPQVNGLVDHLVELRYRLMVAFAAIGVGFALAFVFKEAWLTFLLQPLVEQGTNQLIFTGLPELFFVYLKLAFLSGVFLAFPVLLHQLWRFCAPGLYAYEQGLVKPLLLLAPILFYTGAVFTYLVVMPLASLFFLGMETELISALPSVKEYLSFLTKMAFAFGLAFNLPTFVLLLVAAKLVQVETLAKQRRYVVVGLFVVAAVLTPPDPASQLALALPMIVLYEGALFAARLMVKFTAKSPK